MIPTAKRSVVIALVLGGAAAAGEKVVLIDATEFGRGLAVNNPSASYSIAFSTDKNRLLVADQESDGQRNGRVFVFERSSSNSWQEIQQIVDQGPSPHAGSFFPHVLGHGGDWLAVGAPHDLPRHPNTVEGSVQMFLWDEAIRQYAFRQWIQPGPAIWSSSQSDDEFGMCVAVDGDWALVGAPWSDRGSEESDEGAAYFYQLDSGSNWVFRQQVWASDMRSNAWFGIGLDIRGTNAFIAASRAGDRYGSGRIYWFVENGETWSEKGYIALEGGDVANLRLNAPRFDGTWLKIAGPTPTTQWSTGRFYLLRLDNGNFSQDFVYAPSGLDPYSLYGPGEMHYPYVLASARGQSEERGFCDVFKHDGTNWNLIARLAPDDLEPMDRFGHFAITDGEHVYVVASGVGNSGLTNKTMRLYSFEIMSHYRAWLHDYFPRHQITDPSLRESLWGQEADPNGDGIPNLLKYAAGLGPYDPSDQLPKLDLQFSPADGIQFFYVQRKSDQQLRFTPEWAGNPGQAWVSGEEDIEVVDRESLSADMERVFYRERTQMGGDAPTRSFRIRIVLHDDEE